MHHVGCMASPEPHMVQGPPSASPVEGGGESTIGNFKYVWLDFSLRRSASLRFPLKSSEILPKIILS
jgi:hypothetical protein